MSFTDTLPTGLTPGSVVSSTCNGTVSVSGQQVVLAGGGPVAGAAGWDPSSCAFTVNVTGANSTGTTFTATNAPANYSAVSFTDAVLGAVTPAINTVTLSVTPPTTVSVKKSFDATVLPQTGTTNLTITLTNVTSTDATINVFTDDLLTMGGAAAGFVVGYSPAPSTTCTGGTTITAPAGQTVISASGGIIPAGGSCTIKVPVYLKSTGSDYGQYNNSIAVGALQTSVGSNQAPATAPLYAARALEGTVGINKSSIVSGIQTAKLTFTLIRYAGVAAMSGINFSQALPQTPWAMTMVAGSAQTTCAGGTASFSGNTLTMTGGTLPDLGATGNSCTITVDVMAPAGSSGMDTVRLLNGAATANVASAAGAPATTVSSVTYFNGSAVSLTALNSRIDLSKDFNLVTVPRNGVSLLRIPILNNNADAIALTGVSITDNLPTGMVIAPTPGATFTNDTGSTGCTMPAGSSITAVPGSSTLTLTGASVAAGSKCILSVNVVASYAGNLINSIPANALTTTEGLKSPLPVSATITSTGTADPYVTKARSSGTVVAGSSVTYSVVFGNKSGDPLAGVSVKDPMPAGATSMNWSCVASGTSCPSASGTGGIDALATLPVGATLTYTVTVQVPAGATGDLVNTATIGAPGGVTDSDPDNNSATVTDPITGAPATLTISKSDGSGTYTPGGAAIYSIVVGNSGPGNATGVTVVDNLPTGVTLSGPVTCVVAGTANCGTVTGTAAGGTSAGATGASINAGAGNTLTFSVPVKFASSLTGNVVNNVTATPATGNPATASDTDTPVLKADLAVTKTAMSTGATGTYLPGKTLNYTIAVGNNGVSDLTGVSVSDTVPPTVTVSNWNCSASGTGASCGSTSSGTTNSISLSNVTLPAGTAIAITVTGTASISATGDIANTVTATPPNGVTCTTAPCAKTATVTNTNAGSPQLSIAKSATPGTFAVGAPGSYAISVKNTGTSATSGNIVVSDPLPTGITATLPITATGWDCSASSASVVSCTSSNVLIPDASAPVINVPVAIANSAAALSINTARVSGGGDSTCTALPPAARCQASVSTAVNAPKITVKKVLQNPLVYNVANSYIITATNNGQAATLAGTLTDPIPAGLVIGTLPAGCTASGQTLTCDIPAGLINGSSVSYTIPVTPNDTVIGQALSNTATATGAGDPTCPAGSNCKDTATGTVTAPQLLLEKTVNPTTLVVGQEGRYTLKVTNQGTTATTAVATVTDAIPVSLIIGTLPNGCTANGQTISCTIAAGLGVNASTSFIIPVQARAVLVGQSVTNNAGVTGGGDPGCPAGTATASLPARCKSDVTAPVSAPQMTIVKSASANWAVGVPASYTLEVTNSGSAASFGTITVTDIIPGTLTLGTLPAGCTAVGQQVTCTSSAVLDKGGKISFVIPVTPSATSAPSVSNTATVQGGGDPVCPNAANCSSTVVTPVTAPRLQITETANGPWTIGMSGAAYTVTVTNVGPATTTGLVTVNATLPAGLAPGWSGTTTANGWSCTATGQGIACTATPNLAQNGSSAFTLPVTVLATAVPSVTTPAAVGGGGDPFNGGTTPAAGATCTTLDASPAPNHCATVTLPIPTSGAVTTVKTLDAGTKTPLVPGQLVTYVLTATNSGGTDVTNYTLNEVVPAGATFTSITGGTSSCTAGAAAGTLCTVTIASVPAGGAASARISFTLLKNLPASLKQIVNVITEPAACAGALCDAPPTPPGCTGTSCTPVNVCTAGDPHCVSTPLTPPAGPVAIPTVSEWMLLIMAMMLAMMGVRQMRRS